MKLSYLKMFLLSLLVISLVACGGKKDEPQPEPTPQEELAKPAEETVEATPEVVDTTAKEPVKEEVKEDTKKEEPKKVPATGDYSTNPMNAYVVALNEVAAGKDGKVSKSDAQSLLSRNQILAVRNKDNGNVYLVYHSNGTFAGKDLANMADVEIGILGKVKKVSGVNVIMADKIRPIR